MTQSRLAAFGKIAAAWIPAVLLILVFTPAGLDKFSDTSGWAIAFRHWGYPRWFRIAIGVIEVGAAACLLWGRTAVIGAALVICVMLGAMTTHVLFDGGRHLTSEVVPLVLASIVVAVRRREIRRLLPMAATVAACHSSASPSPEPVRNDTTPSATSLFDRYVAALGGATAVREVRTRVTIGELVTAGGNHAPLEIYQATPDRLLRVLRNTQVKLSQNGFADGRGWSWNDGQARDIAGPELEMLRREYDLQRPLVLAPSYARLSAVQTDTNGGSRAYRVVGTTPQGADEVLYFDRDSGLLRGWDMMVQGTVITTRLEDYRAVAGVLVPFRVVRIRPGFSWTEQASDVRHNVPIDDVRFRKP